MQLPTTSSSGRAATRWLAACAVGAAIALIAGCASGGGSVADGTNSAASRRGVEVFGVIDVGVSHTTNKSERR